MLDEIQQLALINALLTNWDGISIRMGSLSPSLALQLKAIARQLANAQSMDDLARIVDDLLDLTQGTAANSYVSDLVGRSRLTAPAPGGAVPPPAPGASPAPAPSALPSPSPLRETGAAVSRNVPSASATWIHAEATGQILGEALIQTSTDTSLAHVPVFFATNRTRGTQPTLPFLGDIGSEISYGLVPVTIPVAAHQIGQVETPRWWEKLLGRNDDQSFITLGDLQSLKAAAFASKLEAELQNAAANDLLVFLHGYNVTFEEAARKAAQFAYDTKFPGIVVLFSWPSLGALSRYTADEDRALASSDSLARFFKTLEGGPWRNVHVLAHSMGNRVALLGLADNPRPAVPLGQFVFVAADVYVPVFKEKFPKLQRAGKLSATLYASKRDNALLLSDFLHKGDRVGFIKTAPYVTDDLETIDATAVDKGWLGHSYFADQRSLLTDIGLLLRQGLDAQERGLESAGKYWAFPK